MRLRHAPERAHEPSLGVHPHRRLAWTRRLAFVAISAFAGCASTGISVTQTAGQIDDPPSGMPIHIAEVRDARDFQETAGRTARPSLAGDARQPGGRARAVGRATNVGGRPGANVLLDPEQNVEGLVRDAVGRALRSAGFRVLESGDVDFETSPAMRVSIEELWMWEKVPSYGAVTRIRMRVRLAAPLPGLETGEAIAVEYELVRGGFTYSMWRQTLEHGLDELTQRAEMLLSRVRAATEAWLVPERTSNRA